MTTTSRQGDWPSLLDPESCGEDLLWNAGRVLEIAPAHCAGCSDYHIRSILQRTSGITKGIDVDRPELIDLLARLVGARASSGNRLEVFIAGSADTGVLATCAHAAAMAGAEVLGRTHFTVADRCATPLMLCEAFAQHHRLALRTLACDLLTDPLDLQADLIVMHSLLRFLDADAQVALLARLGERLRPGGLLVVSHRLVPPDLATREFSKRAAADAAVMRRLRRGEIPAGQGVEAVEEILTKSRDDAHIRPGEMTHADQVAALVGAAGLEMRHAQVLQRAVQVTPEQQIDIRRIIAVLARRGDG